MRKSVQRFNTHLISKRKKKREVTFEKIIAEFSKLMKDIKSEPQEMLQISSKINTNKMIHRKMIINLMEIKGKILKAMREKTYYFQRSLIANISIKIMGLRK